MPFKSAPLLATLLLLGGAVAPSSCRADEGSAETQGRADRLTFENWINGLGGEPRRGADFWAQERSKPQPVSCITSPPTPEYRSACQEAQRRLALSDVRRRTEPDYRRGWNAPLDAAEGSAKASASNASTSSRPSPTTASTWYIASPKDRLCFPLRDNFEGASTPEQVVALFAKENIRYLVRRSDNGTVFLHNMSDPNNILALFQDKDFCEYATKIIGGR